MRLPGPRWPLPGPPLLHGAGGGGLSSVRSHLCEDVRTEISPQCRAPVLFPSARLRGRPGQKGLVIHVGASRDPRVSTHPCVFTASEAPAVTVSPPPGSGL